MHEHVVKGVSVLAYGHSLDEEAVLHEAFVAVFAENHLLAVAQVYCAVSTHLFVGDGVVNAVVEDDAVLQHFYH